MFERYVNSKDNQTGEVAYMAGPKFERYVNSKDNQTHTALGRRLRCLRDM